MDFKISNAGRLVAAAVVFLATAGNALANDVYGSIFYSQTTGAVGSWNQGTFQGQADGFAKGFCGMKGAKDCEMVVQFKNSCGALFISPTGGWAAGHGKDKAAANFSAGLGCNIRTNSNNCVEKIMVCTQ